MVFRLDLLEKDKSLGRAQMYPEDEATAEHMVSLGEFQTSYSYVYLVMNGESGEATITWQLPHLMSILAVVYSQSGRIYSVLD